MTDQPTSPSAPSDGVLDVDGLRISVRRGNRGLRLVSEGELEPLALVVNGALDGSVTGLREAADRNAGMRDGQALAGPPSETFDLVRARAQWRRWTGRELGDDVFVVGTMFTPSVAVPRRALIEILDRLSSPSPPELLPPRPAEDSAGSAPPPPSREEVLEEIERRAQELDRVAAAPDRAPEAAAKRLVLLLALDEAGLLGDDRAADAELERPGLDHVRAYRRAARELAGYLNSDERRRELPHARPEPVLGAPVSLDWFRAGVDPAPEFSPRQWTALGERLLAGAEIPLDDEGRVFLKETGQWYRLRWRRDYGTTPALVELEALDRLHV